MTEKAIEVYTIKAKAGSDIISKYENALSQLFTKIREQRIIKITVFIDSVDNADFLAKKSSILSSKLLPYFVPVSVLSQKPLSNCGLAIEVFCMKESRDIEFEEKQARNHPYLLVSHKNYKKMIACGLQYDAVETNILKQSEYAFEIMQEILRAEGMDFSDIIRQWNYIERIVDYEDENQHYQIFNDIRTRYYAKSIFKNGYPSATGIGTNAGGVCVDFIALKANLSIIPVKSPVQTDAHQYNDKVLENNKLVSGVQKSSPKFERAKIIDFKDFALVYISGTAAIKGQDTIELNAAEQTRLTIKNINDLVSKDNFVQNNFNRAFQQATIQGYRVYVKNEEDYLSVAQACKGHYTDIPILFIKSDICRPTLLVEIEALMVLD